MLFINELLGHRPQHYNNCKINGTETTMISARWMGIKLIPSESEVSPLFACSMRNLFFVNRFIKSHFIDNIVLFNI